MTFRPHLKIVILVVFYLLIVPLVLFTYSSGDAFGMLRIGINQGNVDPLPIAIDVFDGQTWEEKDLGREITDIIENNLQSSGLFRSIDKAAFLEKPILNKELNFLNWRRINATAVVAGFIKIFPQHVQLQFKIWDPYSEKQIEGIEYKFSNAIWRKYAHKISDVIYSRLTGEKGYFDTKILFISESGPAKNRIKKLSIMDQDGANYRSLTDGKNRAMTPRFDSKGHNIVYAAYHNRVCNIYLLNLLNGVQKLIGHFPGIAFAPRFSHDDSHVIFSIAKDGSTNIYELSLHSSHMRRVTNDIGAINTSPCYSPDGGKIVFNSDRAGSSQIYTMNRDGSDIRRISSGTGTYRTPVWSPRGDFIAFTKMEGGAFYIGVMRIDGSGERLLTTSWMDEGPTWSPNGRIIMFTRQKPNGAVNLYSIDITGYNERLIPTPTFASDPYWSNLQN